MTTKQHVAEADQQIDRSATLLDELKVLQQKTQRLSPTTTKKPRKPKRQPATPSLHRQATDLLLLVLKATPYGQKDVGGSGARIHCNGTFSTLVWDADGFGESHPIIAREQFERMTDTDEVTDEICELLPDVHRDFRDDLTMGMKHLRAKIDAAKAAARKAVSP